MREEIYHMDPPKNYLHAPKAVFDPLYQVMKVDLHFFSSEANQLLQMFVCQV